MSRPRLAALLCFGLPLCLAVHLAAAQPRMARDTTAVMHELASATEAARIPLLLELLELRRDEPATLLGPAEEALALLAEHPSALRESRALAARSAARHALGDYPAALADARRAQDLARRERKDDLLAEACYQAAMAAWRLGSYRSALADAGEARRLLEPRGDSTPLVRTLNALGGIQMAQGDLDTALEMYLAALRMGEALGDRVAAARARNNVGMIYWQTGRPAEAYGALRQALDTFEQLGPKAALARALGNVGLVLIDLQRPREAVPYLERALELDRKSGDLYGQAKDFSNLGYAHDVMGQMDRASEFHRQALELRQRIGDREGIVRSMAAQASVYRKRGDPAGAMAILDASIALADSINDRPDLVAQLEALSEARASTGDAAGALEAYRRFHQEKMALEDSTDRRHLAELEARFRTRENERELAALHAEANQRRREFRRLLAGSIVLGVSLVLLGIVTVLRGRARRALAESERRYRALFQTAADPMFLIEATTRQLLDLNEPARTLCGREAGGTIDELDPEWVRRALTRLFDAGMPETALLDESWNDPAGQLRWVETRSSPLRLSGRAVRLVGLRDTTEAHARDEARFLEEKMRSLGVLAGGIAHDFNNALTAIAGHVGLARQVGPAERGEMLDRAEAATMSAARLTGQLLAFSRGGQPVRRSAAVRGMIHEAIALAGAGSHMRIEVIVPDDVWPVQVDPGQFCQVVSNLVINAQQATGAGGILRIRACNIESAAGADPPEPPRRMVRIDFEDNGAGIPEAIRGRVFDPYFTTRSHGNGLGLATAFAICRNHGGGLTFESIEGRGTTFSADFPAAGEAPREAPPTPADSPGGAGRILVLDDEPLVRSAITLMMEQWGYEVEAVADGRVAVDRYLERKCAGAPFDLLIMDLTIPGGTGGRQAMSEILRHDPDARAIVASGYSDDPTLASYREAGFSAALAKPFLGSELARVVKSVLAEPRPVPRPGGDSVGGRCKPSDAAGCDGRTGS